MSTLTQSEIPVAVTIAGSDSGGGAGIQADLRSFRAFGVHGCTAITALTAQNPHGVTGVLGATPEILRKQLECIAEDFDVCAVKTGMLLNADLIRVVAEMQQCFPSAAWVIDPVMVATSGARLLDPEAEETMMTDLLPKATLITPNLPEAMVLAGTDECPTTREDLRALACALHQRYHTAVLLKGGHTEAHPASDIFCDAEGTTYLIETPVIPNPLTTHGTGCALSSAITANLALGRPLLEAILQAKAYLMDLIAAGAIAGKAAVYGPEGADCETDVVTCERI